MTKAWFSYIGPPGGELQANNYYYSMVKPTCFQGTSSICAVYADYIPATYGNHPSPFDNNLILYIAAAKATSYAQPINISFRKYVYTLSEI
jgi:hypothetical protein